MMQFWRNRSRIVSAVLMLSVAGLMLQAAPPADAAGRGGQGGFFDQLISIFAPSAATPAPAPQPAASRRADPLYPYSGASKPAPRQSAVYRTVCVRLCDGYYWPVSEATPESRFRRDSSVCESSCSQEAKLYYAPRGDSDATLLMGLDGKPYTDLATAFLYRKALQPQCQCKPGPWADSEIARHKQYAADAAAKEQQVAMSEPPPTTPTDDAAPLPDTDGQLGNAAAVAADGAITAHADALPAALRPMADPARATPAVVKPRRAAKPNKPVARAQPAYSDPLSFATETVDSASHRYIPLR